MTLRIAVLRPEPGNAATADALEHTGHAVLRLPLFAVRALPWEAPDPATFDALLLTSANAVRHAGDDLTRLARLPVIAVGRATASAARQAMLRVAVTGDGDGADALAAGRAQGFARIIHLAGREHRALRGVTVVATYASDVVPITTAALDALTGSVALLHSARAARRLADLIGGRRPDVAIAALSAAVADAAGGGWRGAAVADTPTDAALRTAAIALAAEIDQPEPGGDKRS